MNATYFSGRDAELELLDDLWDSPRAAFLILYGRRRVGKTSLLTHWMERTSHRILYWVAVPTTSQEQLRSFSQALYRFTHTGDSPLHSIPLAPGKPPGRNSHPSPKASDWRSL